MKTVPLTKGKLAFVDDDDFERVSQFKWQAHRNTRSKREVWYACRGTGKSFTTMHTFIMGSPWHDHIDGDGLNNRRSNLRKCTRSQNMANRRKQAGSCGSRFKGVTPAELGRWKAQIRFNAKKYHLGRFDQEEDAAIAYNVAAQLCFGEFACLNAV